MENRRSDRMSSGEFFLECRRLRRVYRLGVLVFRKRCQAGPLTEKCDLEVRFVRRAFLQRYRIMSGGQIHQ